MDVHIFDGKLHDSRDKLAVHLTRAQSINKELKQASFLTLRAKLKLNPIANRSLNAIINGAGSNYDQTNDLHADDLLYLCCELINLVPDQSELINLINKQLQEMATGLCAQGRTHRLLGVVLAFAQYFKD